MGFWGVVMLRYTILVYKYNFCFETKFIALNDLLIGVIELIILVLERFFVVPEALFFFSFAHYYVYTSINHDDIYIHVTNNELLMSNAIFFFSH